MTLRSTVLLLTTLLPTSAPAEEGQIVVPMLSTSGVDPASAPVITELVLESLLSRHGLPALGPSDLKDMLNVEQQRQLIGCDEGACLSELAGALGSARLVSGMIGKLGDSYVVTLKLIDLSSAQAIARASTRFNRLEGAEEAVGPLVDELVGRRAKPRSPLPEAAEKAKPKAATGPTPSAVSPESFCRTVLQAYARKLLEGASRSEPLAERRALLLDLLFTPFLGELEAKLTCFSEKGAALLRDLASLSLAATNPEGVARARWAAAEWAAAEKEVQLVVEVYRAGSEKEKLGTGSRPAALPFAPKAAQVAAPPEGPDLDRYRQAYHAGAEVVAQALKAVETSQKPAFLAQFSTPQDKGAPDPRDVYVDVLGDSERSLLDTAPSFVLEDTQLVSAARTLKEKARLVVHVRRIDRKSGFPSLRPVLLAQNGRVWRVVEWPKQ